MSTLPTQTIKPETIKPETIKLVAFLALLVGCSRSAPLPTQTATSSGPAAQEVLEKMRTVYRQAESYTDNSTIVEYSVSRAKGVETEFPYQQLSVAIERPNKFCVTFTDAAEGAEGKTDYKIASNGKVVRSSANEVPLQIHEAVAPQVATAENFIPEPLLRAELLQVSLENIYPQIALLLCTDSGQPIFPRDDQHRLLKDAELKGKPCYRVQMVSPAGKRVLWIDKEEYLLRRMELPIDARRKAIDPNEQLSSLSICLDFEAVTLDADIHENSFEIEIPTGGRRVRRFIPPPPPVPTDSGKSAVEEHQELVEQYDQALAAATIKDSILEVEFSKPEVGPRNLPEQWQLKQVWQTSPSDMARPGDVVLVGEANRTLVLDGGDAIVELDALGQVIGRHELPTHPEEKRGLLRTSIDSQGKFWYLASGVGWQQVYLLNDAWNVVLSFPDGQHSGIGDVHLADLTNLGKPTMHIGYWGGIGIQGGTIDGRRLWANRSLDHVLQITSGPADEAGQPTLWCISTRGTILQLSASGKSLQELYIAGQALMYVAWHPSADTHCGLAIKELGWYSAVGFSADGTKQWEYPLPPGEYVTQVPRIQYVQFPVKKPDGDSDGDSDGESDGESNDGSGGQSDGKPDEENGWLIAAAGGSLHWLDNGGKLIDRFDTGELITGVAMSTDAKETRLLISTGENLTAWSIER